MLVSDAVAKAWLVKYGGLVQLKHVQSAGHLENWYGERIRGDAAARGLSAKDLSVWLEGNVRIQASVVTCQTWLTKDWSSSDKLLSPQAVETALGDKLRLHQYEARFGDDAVAAALAEELAESQPAYLATGELLRQWYVLHHPKSGPVEYKTA